MLLEHHIQSLPVTKDNRLTAMVTTADFLRGYSAAHRGDAAKFGAHRAV